jgi:hypothetical protein
MLTEHAGSSSSTGKRNPAVDLERGVLPAPEHGHAGHLEVERVPGTLQVVLELASFLCRAGLADAPVGREAGREARQIIATRADGLQQRLKFDEGFFGFGREPYRGLARRVLEDAELSQRHQERCYLRARFKQTRQRFLEPLGRVEGVEQVDVRHPAAELPVVPLANGLDRLPHLLGRDDGHGGLVRLARHCLGLPGKSKTAHDQKSEAKCVFGNSRR